MGIKTFSCLNEWVIFDYRIIQKSITAVCLPSPFALGTSGSCAQVYAGRNTYKKPTPPTGCFRNRKVLFQTLLFKIKECTAVVDFRFRMLAFRRGLVPYAPINYYLWLKTTIFQKRANRKEKRLF